MRIIALNILAKGLVVTTLALGFIPLGYSQSVDAAAQQITKDFQNHKYKLNIEYVVENNLMWLFPDGNFQPDKQLTQAEIIAGLVQTKKLTQGSAVPGLPAGHWAKGYYEKAMKDGVLKNVVIAPNKVLTREEAAILIVNAWENLRQSRTKKESVEYKGRSNIEYVVGSGWITEKSGSFPNGVPTTKYDSKSNMTRGDLAFSLHQLHMDYIGIQDAEKLFMQFNKSMKLSNGILTGTVPSSQKYALDITLYLKGPKVIEHEKTGNLLINVSQATEMVVRIVRKGEAIPLAYYHYNNLPHSLNHKNIRR